jgi:hypothetical protein
MLNPRTLLLATILSLTPFALSVCAGCPANATCPRDGGQADYDDTYEENGVVYCVYVHNVQTPSGPSSHRFKTVCK